MKVQQNLHRKIVENSDLKKKAERLKPALHHEKVYPDSIIRVEKNDQVLHGWKTEQMESAAVLSSKSYRKDDTIILDFGKHCVGYLHLYLKPEGSPPDAPLKMKLTFGEMPVEVAEDFDTYDGWLSSSWLQEETIVIDVLPAQIELPRRYSFRYLKVEILDTSVKYQVSINHIFCETVTSASVRPIPAPFSDPVLTKIDDAGIKTLIQCMQDVFEDGPKRDRRLWLGDLRLQALVNYKTVKDYQLVKRCLYLFAAVPNEQGQVAANLFIEPQLIPDDTYLFDYSLFFTTSLADYYAATKDTEALTDLWPTACRQIELALLRLTESDIVQDDDTWWSFIDWNEALNKQTASQAVLIYSLKKAIELAEVLQLHEVKEKYAAYVNRLTKSAFHYLWDEKKQLFHSGDDKQISWASQIWMVLAGVFNQTSENQQLLTRLFDENPSVEMNTPYMYHHLAEALIIADMNDKALEIIKSYWGGMIQLGADTFWELYNPADHSYSPYGSHLIVSYCHAWSCTPSYLLRILSSNGTGIQ